LIVALLLGSNPSAATRVGLAPPPVPRSTSGAAA
jgi:hypothetical protein